MKTKETSVYAERFIHAAKTLGTMTYQIGSGRLFPHKKGWNVDIARGSLLIDPDDVRVVTLIKYMEMAEHLGITHLIAYWDDGGIRVSCISHVSAKRDATKQATARDVPTAYNCRTHKPVPVGETAPLEPMVYRQEPNKRGKHDVVSQFDAPVYHRDMVHRREQSIICQRDMQQRAYPRHTVQTTTTRECPPS